MIKHLNKSNLRKKGLLVDRGEKVPSWWEVMAAEAVAVVLITSPFRKKRDMEPGALPLVPFLPDQDSPQNDNASVTMGLSTTGNQA